MSTQTFADQRSILERYQRAEQLLPWNLSAKLKNLSLLSHWIDDQRFWFKRDLCDQTHQNGYEFILVDSEQLTQAPCFDHQQVASALADLLQQAIHPQQLPVTAIHRHGADCLRLTLDLGKAQATSVLLTLADHHCTLEPSRSANTVKDHSLALISPDRRHTVSVRDHNLLLRDPVSGAETWLTKDGEPNYGYGCYSDFLQVSICANQALPPAALWSANGRYLAVKRVDERRVKDMPLLQSVPQDGSQRPLNHPYKLALPGDSEVALGSLCVINVERGDIIPCDRPPSPVAGGGVFSLQAIAWGADCRVYFMEWTHLRDCIRLVAFDPATRRSRVLVEEQGEAYLHPGPIPFEPSIFSVHPAINNFIWYSHRSGWGHLYRYDLSTGKCLNAITQGDYVVTALHHLDTEAGTVLFSACGREPGRNPYYESLYRVNLDGSELVLLTPEDAQHDILAPGYVAADFQTMADIHGVAPNGQTFIDSQSRIDQPPIHVLRASRDGACLMRLSSCDASDLADTPYTPPLAFSTQAADGHTELCGVLHRPSDFDPEQQYPVILAVYGGPQQCVVPKRFADFIQYVGKVARTLAELGFIVVTLDPRGTPLRARAFQDAAFGDSGRGGGIDDQVAALQQLAARHPWLDLERVGITGHSSGGFTAARAMLSHADVFKAGVASAGSYDQRVGAAGWVEPFQGQRYDDDLSTQACVTHAAKLKGKLLLVQGDMDANVHLAQTLQLAHQLIAQNKDFDLLVLPNRGHRYMQDPYFIRRVWDYFVVHLLQQTAPENYSITAPQTPLP